MSKDILKVTENHICTGCGVRNTVCPQIQPSKRIKKIVEEPIVGPVYEDCFLGKPADDTLFMKGQTCGFVRNLLTSAIEPSYAEKIICVRYASKIHIEKGRCWFNDTGSAKGFECKSGIFFCLRV